MKESTDPLISIDSSDSSDIFAVDDGENRVQLSLVVLVTKVFFLFF